MRIEYTLTKKQLWQCHLYFWKKRALPRLLLAAAFCLLIPCLNFIPGYSAGPGRTLGATAVLVFAGLLLRSALLVFSLLERYRKSVKSGVCGECILEIRKLDVFSGKAGTAGYYYHWTDVQDILILPDLLCVTLKRNRLLIVPQSAFADPAEAGQFLALAHQYWEAAKMRHLYAPTGAEGVWPPPPKV